MKLERLPFETITTPNLPGEIIDEILLRLPVHSLLKFRCVCKSWDSLIGSERFRESHLKIYGKDAGQGIIITPYYPCKLIGYCSLNSGVIKSAVFGFLTTIERFDVVGTSNGLICLIVNQRYFVLWNPSTRKSKKILEIQKKIDPKTGCGFGFDELSKDYKVVVTLFGLVDGYRSGTRVYSLKSNSWRPAEDFRSDLPSDPDGGFVGGKLYFGLCGARPDIVSFDLAKEIWRKMEFPCEKCPWIRGRDGACISIKIKARNPNTNTETDFWILVYSRGLDKKYLGKAFQINAKWFSSISISFEPNDTILFARIEDGKVCFRKEKLSASVMRDSHHPLYEAYSYVESLVPLK